MVGASLLHHLLCSEDHCGGCQVRLGRGEVGVVACDCACSEQHICVHHVLPQSHVIITITDKHQINASKSNADPNRCSK